jgi:hypothetical protein
MSPKRKLKAPHIINPIPFIIIAHSINRPEVREQGLPPPPQSTHFFWFSFAPSEPWSESIIAAH